jgi:type IV pilus assembly protein PilO
MKKQTFKDLLDQLRNLDPNDPGRWPFGVRLGTAVLLFLLVAGGAYYFLVWKSEEHGRPKLLEARAKETELMQELEKKARRAANLEAYREQLAEMEKSFGAMLRQLPNKTEVPNLLVDISQTGLAAGLEEKLFKPEGEIRKDFYAELPIKIRLTGDYHEMGRFASGIAALPRIVTLHDIEITPQAGRGKGIVEPGDLVLNVTAKTYRYLDDEEQAPSDAKAKKDRKKGKKKPEGGEA